jgi:PASTA domain
VKTIIAAIVVAIGALALLTACGSTESASAPVVETVTVTETAEAAEQPQPAAAPAAAPAPAAQRSIEVPNVVGIDHQLAQDTMQAAGLYNLSEEDATGQDRLLIWDRNWTVVSQSPSPGSKVSEDQTIVLRSKKDDE